MLNATEICEKIKNYFDRLFWEIDHQQSSRVRLFFLRQIQIAVLVFRDFFADRCMLRASALTYATMLSIVPLLTLMFSLLKGVGAQETLGRFLLKQLTLGSEEIVAAILLYIDNTRFGQLGLVGLVILVLTVLMLLSNIEESFNHIWGVKETRSIFRRFADYSSVVIVGPVFLLAAISMTTTLESRHLLNWLLNIEYLGDALLVLFNYLPYLVMWAAFTSLYIFMPNIKVRFRAALVGGIVGGTLWQFAQWLCIYFQFGVARYNAIYGALAALPIFMVWIYVSWLIVLLGLELTYAWQNMSIIRLEVRGETLSFASREVAVLIILLTVADNFQRSLPPLTLEDICRRLGIPPRLGRELLRMLCELGFLSEVRRGNEETAFLPLCDPATLPLDGIVNALRHDGLDFTKLGKRPVWEIARKLEEQIATAAQTVFAGLTLETLARELNSDEDDQSLA